MRSRHAEAIPSCFRQKLMLLGGCWEVWALVLVIYLAMGIQTQSGGFWGWSPTPLSRAARWLNAVYTVAWRDSDITRWMDFILGGDLGRESRMLMGTLAIAAVGSLSTRRGSRSPFSCLQGAQFIRGSLESRPGLFHDQGDPRLGTASAQHAMGAPELHRNQPQGVLSPFVPEASLLQDMYGLQGFGVRRYTY